MKKYLTITVREKMQGMTVEKVLYDYLELTKKQVSREMCIRDRGYQEQMVKQKGHRADALALRAEERRDKLR